MTYLSKNLDISFLYLNSITRHTTINSIINVLFRFFLKNLDINYFLLKVTDIFNKTDID